MKTPTRPPIATMKTAHEARARVGGITNVGDVMIDCAPVSSESATGASDEVEDAAPGACALAGVAVRANGAPKRGCGSWTTRAG